MTVEPPPGTPQFSYPPQPASQTPTVPEQQVPQAPPAAPGSKKGILPLLAVIFAGVAFLLAVIPATSGAAWAFAITAIVLAIIALVKKRQPKALAIAAIIVAPLAWLVSIIVFIVSLASGIAGIDSAPARPSTGVEQPAAEEPAEEEPLVEAPAADGSSLDAPLPFESTVSVDNWTGKFDVSFGALNWDASALIAAENQFNADPGDGMKYIMVAVTMTNTDKEEWNPYGTLFWADIKLVSGGRGFSEGTIVVVPDSLSDQGDLYPGGTATGNVVFKVPADVADGVWDIEGTFVATQ